MAKGWGPANERVSIPLPPPLPRQKGKKKRKKKVGSPFEEIRSKQCSCNIHSHTHTERHPHTHAQVCVYVTCIVIQIRRETYLTAHVVYTQIGHTHCSVGKGEPDILHYWVRTTKKGSRHISRNKDLLTESVPISTEYQQSVGDSDFNILLPPPTPPTPPDTRTLPFTSLSMDVKKQFPSSDRLQSSIFFFFFFFKD